MATNLKSTEADMAIDLESFLKFDVGGDSLRMINGIARRCIAAERERSDLHAVLSECEQQRDVARALYHAYRELAQGLDDLLVCYRLRKRVADKALDKVEAARAAVSALEDRGTP